MAGSQHFHDSLGSPPDDDADAIALFLGPLRSKFLKYCQREGLEPADAEDVVQEAFTAATLQLRRGNFDGRAALSSWAYRIFRNKLADHQRGSRSGAHVAVVDDLDSWAQATEASPETRLWVREALERLPARERTVLLCTELGGMTAKEVAALLRLNTKTTESVLARARVAFRQALGEARETGARKRLKE